MRKDDGATVLMWLLAAAAVVFVVTNMRPAAATMSQTTTVLPLGTSLVGGTVFGEAGNPIGVMRNDGFWSAARPGPPPRGSGMLGNTVFNGRGFITGSYSHHSGVYYPTVI